LLIGMKNCATLEDILVTSYKAKDNIAQWFSNGVPRYLPEWNANLCPH
jgi:hypothetical protein